MICDRAQADLSRTMDEDHDLSPEASRHLSVCAECAEFRETAVDVSRRYQIQVRAGIDRLRQLETQRPRFSPRRKWLIPFAAAVLLCWWGGEPRPPVALVKAAPAPPSPRIWPVDEAETSFISIRDFLPVRLDDEFLPARASESEITLPRGLRF